MDFGIAFCYCCFFIIFADFSQKIKEDFKKTDFFSFSESSFRNFNEDDLSALSAINLSFRKALFDL